MPKESGPQSGGKMNRRDFLKTAAAAIGLGVGVLEKGAQAQEQNKKILDNHLQEVVELARNTKINFPENFKPVTPEVQNLLLLIQEYQTSFKAGNEPDAILRRGMSQRVRTFGDQKSITQSKVNLWEEFKKIRPNIGDYSEESFYQILVSKVPEYLADYGICLGIDFLAIQGNDKASNTISIKQTEVLASFFQVDRVRRDIVKQDGFVVNRDILFIKGIYKNDGINMGSFNEAQVGQNYFRNILIFEKNLRTGLVNDSKGFADLFKVLSSFSQERLNEIWQKRLEENNQWSKVAQIAVEKIVFKLKTPETFEQYEEETIIHETKHLIDAEQNTIRKSLPFIKTSKPTELRNGIMSLLVHNEISALLSQLKNALNPGWNLLIYINSSKYNNMGGNVIAQKWILKKIIEIVSRNPVKYGIKIEKNKVSIENQILVQLDALIDQPQSLRDLCDEVSIFHNQYLSEDIVGNIDLPTNTVLTPEENFATDLLKIAIPTTVALGGAGYLLKKMNDHKNKIAEKAEANMSRQARRDKERKQAKKNKNPK